MDALTADVAPRARRITEEEPATMGSRTEPLDEQAHRAPVVRITYYTDPLCSWSWALEPHWRRLLREHGDRITWRYRMGGMIADWSNYADPINEVASPPHMAPQWFEVTCRTGVPIDADIWHEDPPASSYPACLAVKAAELQGREVGDAYLALLRASVMTRRRNIARREVLLELAATLPDLSLEAFERALDDGEALEALRDDLRDAREHEIGRFPTLVMQPATASARGLALTGYRPYDALEAALGRVLELSDVAR